MKSHNRQKLFISAILSLVALITIAYKLTHSGMTELWVDFGNQIPSALSHGDAHSSSLSRNASSTEVSAQSLDSPVTKQHLETLKAELFAAQSIEDPSEQNNAFERCMAGISPEIAAALLSSMMPDELGGIAAQRLFDRWATANPKTAMEWAQSLADSKTSQPFMDVAAIRWATTNLAEAAAWARNLPEGDSRSAVMEAISQEAIRIDPIEALRLARELPEGPGSADLFVRASGEWAHQDREGAVEWARQIQDINLRQQVFEQIAIVASAKDLQAAANIALHDMAHGAQQDRALVSIVQRWVQEDPAVASSWVSQFPDDSLGQDAAETLVNLWAQADLKASGDWLSSLPPSQLRNRAVLAYSRVLRLTDAPAAERWESLITHAP